jgi:acyl-CoA dehydrogenase
MTNNISYFNDTHQQVRDSIEKFFAKEVTPFINEWEEECEFPREIYTKTGNLGFLGIGYPEVYGGTGEGDIFMKIAANEAMMKSTSGGLVASLGSIDIGLPPIVSWGSDELKQKVIPEVVRGEKICALAITEPSAGSDVANIRTRAVKEGANYRVNGSKIFITSGVRADYYTVAVRTGGDGYSGISLLLIEKGTPGFTLGKKLKKMGWHASDTAELFFEDCLVPTSNLIGPENGGFRCITTNFMKERLSLAVMAYMTAQLALDEALNYVKEREAFGRPIGKYQVIRHKLVDMATEVEIAREFTYRVAAKMQANQTPIKEIAMAKNFATDVAERTTREAVQIFGGMGYMQGTVVERLYRDAKILSIGGGTTEIMKEMIAKQMKL